MALIFGLHSRPAGYTFQGHARQIEAGLSCRGTWWASSTLRVLVSQTMANHGTTGGVVDTGPPALILWHDVELFLAGDMMHRFICVRSRSSLAQDSDPTGIEPR